MKKISFLFLFCGVIALACSDDDSGDPSVCRSQSSDFDTCLECCQDNGFSGASMPIGGTCECVN